MKTNVLLILSAAILFGCPSCNQNSTKGGLIEIDIAKKYPSKKVLLRDIANIEYLLLETSDDVLLGTPDRISYVSDKYIFLQNISRGNLYLFSRDGKIITRFNRMGKGGNEYSRLFSAVFDEKNEEVFVFDHGKIFVYSITGAHKRTLECTASRGSISAYNFDDETILLYDEWVIKELGDIKAEPYLLLSKKDGSIVSTLDIRLSERYSWIKYIFSEEGARPVYANVHNNRCSGRDFVIADISSDTVYKLTNKMELTPLLVRSPSVHASEPRTVWASPLMTDKFILLHIVTLDFDAIQRGERSRATMLMYEFESGETSEISLVHDDYPGRWWPELNISTHRNMAISILDAPMLKNWYKEGQLKGELEQLAGTLKEDDNPVVMIVKFK